MWRQGNPIPAGKNRTGKNDARYGAPIPDQAQQRRAAALRAAKLALNDERSEDASHE